MNHKLRKTAVGIGIAGLSTILLTGCASSQGTSTRARVAKNAAQSMTTQAVLHPPAVASSSLAAASPFQPAIPAATASDHTIETVAYGQSPGPITFEDASAGLTGIVRLNQWQCVESAIANHAKMDVAHHRLHASIAQLDQAKSSYWPQLSSNFSITKIRQEITADIPAAAFGIPIPGNFGLPIAGDEFRTASLDSNLPLYVGGARAAAVDMTSAGVRIAKQETRLTSNDIVSTTRKAYHGTILTRQMLDLATSTRDRLQMTQDLTERLIQAGSESVNRTDLLKGQVAIATTESMLAEAESRYALSRMALANAIGAAAAAEVEASDTELVYVPVEYDLEQMVAQAFVLRPDWVQLQDAVRVAKSQIQLAKSGYHPKVLASGSLLQLEDNVDYGVIQPNGDNWKIGLYAQVPLFTGFRTVNEVREAKSRYAERCAQRRLLEDGIGVQVKAAFLDMIRTRDQVVATETAYRSAIENRELNFRAYQIEMCETEDVIEAQLMETAMRKDHLMALYHWNIALIELDHATGRGIEHIIQ